MTCATCGCAIHSSPQTWEIRCTVCGQMKYPTTVNRPERYVCALCGMVPPKKRATRVEAARKRGEIRRQKASGVCFLTPGANSGAGPRLSALAEPEAPRGGAA